MATAGIDAADATCSANRRRDVIGQKPGTGTDIQHMLARGRFQGFEDLPALRDDIWRLVDSLDPPAGLFIELRSGHRAQTRFRTVLRGFCRVQIRKSLFFNSFRALGRLLCPL